MAVWFFWRIMIVLACLLAVIFSVMRPGLASTHNSQSLQQPSTASFGVFGVDTLKPIPKKYDRLKRSVGRLWSTKDQPISCTAFCVAPDIVATASHCLFSIGPSGRRPPLTSFKVEFKGDQGLTQIKIAGDDERSTRWNVLAGATTFPSRSPLQNTRDWALLRLASKSCNKRSLKISKKKEKRDLMEAIIRKQVFTIGYMRRGDELKLTFSGNCQTEKSLTQLEKVWVTIDNMFVDTRDLIPHRCDFRSGASGSPLFVRTKSGPVVIALNNGTIPVPKRILFGKSGAERRKLILAVPTATNIAVNVSAFVKQIALMRISTERLLPAEIKRLQIFLQSTGHYQGMPDGNYDVPLRQAILNFERERNLLATGRPALSLMQAPRQ